MASTQAAPGVPPGARNRLAKAKSPYLLQHASNPVDWYEWGQEAFDAAKERDVPIFLSIGYSACHWCHSMAHESFENPAIAQIMNENYVNIKVDREERPDVDSLYMLFQQATSGRGGWPLSVFLTPELHPFFSGTYWPPRGSLGRPGFPDVLQRIAQVWREDPSKVRESGASVIAQLAKLSSSSASSSTPADVDPPISASKIYAHLSQRFDPRHGGFSTAPKFPSPSQTLRFLSRYAAYLASEKTAGKVLPPGPAGAAERKESSARMGLKTLKGMWEGGIHDWVGNGFSRYSVDERWHLPHFEKMLYDEAQLISSALELALLPPNVGLLNAERELLFDFAADIIRYSTRDMANPMGGFFSAEDADSFEKYGDTHPKEGAFYVWTAQEIDDVLAPLEKAEGVGKGPLTPADVFKHQFGVKPDGNVDPQYDIQGELVGKNVLYLASHSDETALATGRSVEEVDKIVSEGLKMLKDYRDTKRPRPHLDDKIVTAWQGLMISALSTAFTALPKRYETLAAQALSLAESSALFVKANVYNKETGELRRSWREGRGPVGQADDYAFLIDGLINLYQATGKEEYVTWAIDLQAKQDEIFYDHENGGYFSTAPDPSILIRLKDFQDGAEPSALSVTLLNLERLSAYAEDNHVVYSERFEGAVKANAAMISKAPHALATSVNALLDRFVGHKQIIVTGQQRDPRTQQLLAAVRSRFIPNLVLIHFDPTAPPKQLAEKNATLRSLIESNLEGEVTPNVRVCENFACGLPVTALEEVEKVIA